MVEFDLKVNKKQRTAYVPRQVVKNFGTDLKLLPNFHAGVIYSQNEPPANVIASLKVIIQDLELRKQSPGGEK